MSGVAAPLAISSGSMPILFTAPHGIAVARDGHGMHKQELHTTSLAKAFAAAVGGCTATWCDESCRTACDARNRDPNFLLTDELESNAWNAVLQSHLAHFGGDCAHVDVHGRRDPGADNDQSDCDVGIMPMLQLGDAALAESLRSNLEISLRAVLRELGFVVNANPTLHGFWPLASGRWTLSMQGVRHSLRSVQLELSLRLRKALQEDADFRERFAVALCTVLCPTATPSLAGMLASESAASS
eukprot:TRINITY_DN69795_c0_g1_i1.p1 TRINITY_DN69795_c0_g1~~TRINITY_DN69795_c0_g1_i1.p1  ORF type:complete len:243 (+),score=39.09 TRINITY_DN69795_c0_g1_i1:78-806(+)